MVFIQVQRGPLCCKCTGVDRAFCVLLMLLHVNFVLFPDKVKLSCVCVWCLQLKTFFSFLSLRMTNLKNGVTPFLEEVELIYLTSGALHRQ